MRDHRPGHDPDDRVDITEAVRSHTGEGVRRGPTPPKRKPVPRKVRRKAKRRNERESRRRNR